MTKITDEMVERFSKYVAEHEGCMWRAALEAALNPPKEPEIVVTEEQIKAGRDGYERANQISTETMGLGGLTSTGLRGIYTVMRRLEPLPEVTDEAAEVARSAYIACYGGSEIGRFRAALTAALPYLVGNK